MYLKIKSILEDYKKGLLKIDCKGHSYKEQILKDMDKICEEFFYLDALPEDSKIEVDMTKIHNTMAKDFPDLFKSEDKDIIENNNKIIYIYTKEEKLDFLVKKFENILGTIYLKIDLDSYRCTHKNCYSSECCAQPFTAFKLRFKNNIISPVREVTEKIEHSKEIVLIQESYEILSNKIERYSYYIERFKNLKNNKTLEEIKSNIINLNALKESLKQTIISLTLIQENNNYLFKEIAILTEEPRCGEVKLNQETRDKQNMFYILYGVLVHNYWYRKENTIQRYYFTEGVDIEIEFKDDKFIIYLEDKNKVFDTSKEMEIELRKILKEDYFE